MTAVLVRHLVAEHLAAALTATGVDPATYVIRPHTATLDGLDRPAIILRTEAYTPADTGANAWYEVALVALLAVPRTEPGTADDDIDAWLLDVLAALALDDAAGLRWTGATRAVLDEAWPCYELTLTATIDRQD